MPSLSPQLSEELRSECGHTLEEILARKSDNDYQQLKSLLVEDREVEPIHLQNAINLLGRWGNNEVIPNIVALMPQLDERGLINTIDALGHLGGAESLRAIEQYENHESADVRRFVVSALDRISTEESINKLTNMARSDPSGFVRSKARKLLDKRSNR